MRACKYHIKTPQEYTTDTTCPLGKLLVLSESKKSSTESLVHSKSDDKKVPRVQFIARFGLQISKKNGLWTPDKFLIVAIKMIREINAKK